MSHNEESWREMDPWEKARRWQKVSPELTEVLVAQASAHADEQMRIEAEKARHAMQLAEEKAKHEMRLAKENVKHLHEIDRRRAQIQLIGTVGGFACILGLILVAALYADTGNVLPGLAIFSLGTGLTAGIYGLQWSVGKDIKAFTEYVRALEGRAAVERAPGPRSEAPPLAR